MLSTAKRTASARAGTAWLALLAVSAISSANAAPGQPEWAGFGEPGHQATRTVAIIATEMKFMPSDLAIARGETVKFVITNRGKMRHEFVIGDQAFQAQHMREMAQMPGMTMSEANEADLAPGQTKTIVWRFSKAGEFLFACDLPGHAQQGMLGHIHVR
jgi:uncharacterized cupredoxin-like copper-binding protein